jgi:hypothetical protein
MRHQGQATEAAVHKHHLCLLCLCRLVALPEHRCRAAAAAAAHAPATGCDAVADNRIEHFLCAGKALDYPPAQRQLLHSQWTKVLRRLQKAAEVRAFMCISRRDAVDTHTTQQCESMHYDKATAVQLAVSAKYAVNGR